jgi:predicted component of type VI protein secretion system
MTRLLILGILGLAAAGCPRNKSSEEPGTRIRDTTLTAKDTTNPNDTLPHIRDSAPDSSRADSAQR